MRKFDVLVVGGGMAGVSIGFELASDRAVGLVEMEPSLAFHATGRSAATFLESYGSQEIRVLTTCSRAFLESPAATFESPPLTPRPQLWIAPGGGGDQIRELYAEVSPLVPHVRVLEPEEARVLNPTLRPGYVELAMLEPGAMEIDVHAVHQGYVRGLRERRGEVVVGATVVRATRSHGVWTVSASNGDEYRAPVVVNAAGAWVDDVARVAGAKPVGILPLRRTIFMAPALEGLDTSRLPLTADVRGTFYVKPEGAQFLCSPADEGLQSPGDAQPDEVEIARALDSINEATTLNLRHVRARWAGLRSFVADRVPVVGFDSRAEGFFWLGGQGGYGIQTAPALARVGAALVRGVDLPLDLLDKGLTAAALAPDRATTRASGSH